MTLNEAKEVADDTAGNRHARGGTSVRNAIVVLRDALRAAEQRAADMREAAAREAEAEGKVIRALIGHDPSSCIPKRIRALPLPAPVAPAPATTGPKPFDAEAALVALAEGLTHPLLPEAVHANQGQELHVVREAVFRAIRAGRGAK